MRKVLKLKFKNGQDKTTFISIANFKADLSADTVKAAMAQIAGAKAFNKDGVEMYVKPVAAYYHTTSEDEVFTEATADVE